MKKNINYLNKIKLLKEQGRDFDIYVSKRSKKIVMMDEVGPRGGNVNHFYSDKKLNPLIFHLCNKIKYEADIYFGINSKDINPNRNTLRYYNYNVSQFNDIGRFYYVDFSACYLRVLNNRGVISDGLYTEINRLPKQDRLVCLGMLAYEPYRIRYRNGERYGAIEQIKNEYSHVFYLACQLTQELMENIIRRVNNDYIFYWVDGIFFKNPVIFYAVRDWLKSINMPMRFGSCSQFKFIDKGKYYHLSFYQSDKNKLEIKRYNIPVFFRDMELRRSFYENILNGNYEQAADISDQLNKFGELNK